MSSENPQENLYPHGFFMVDNRIFQCQLHPIALAVYCYLCKCDNPTQGCYPSKRNIAEACNVAVSSVSKSLTELRERGLIDVRHNYEDRRQINNSYTLRRDAWKPNPDQSL